MFSISSHKLKQNFKACPFNTQDLCIFFPALAWRGHGASAGAGEHVEVKASEYLSSLLHFVLASGISKLLLYTELLWWDRRKSEQRVSLCLCLSLQCSLLTRLQTHCQSSLNINWAAGIPRQTEHSEREACVFGITHQINQKGNLFL